MGANMNEGGQSGDQGNQGSYDTNLKPGDEGYDARGDVNNENYDPNWRPATTGAVIDPENDGRLKENREVGRTKGTTEHSSKAPHVDQDNSGSVNADADRPAQETYQGPGGEGGQSGGGDGQQ